MRAAKTAIIERIPDTFISVSLCLISSRLFLKSNLNMAAPFY